MMRVLNDVTATGLTFTPPLFLGAPVTLSAKMISRHQHLQIWFDSLKKTFVLLHTMVAFRSVSFLSNALN